VITWVAYARIAQPIVEGVAVAICCFLSNEVWLMFSAQYTTRAEGS